jgi:hypothetical protein
MRINNTNGHDFEQKKRGREEGENFETLGLLLYSNMGK